MRGGVTCGTQPSCSGSTRAIPVPAGRRSVARAAEPDRGAAFRQRMEQEGRKAEPGAAFRQRMGQEGRKAERVQAPQPPPVTPPRQQPDAVASPQQQQQNRPPAVNASSAREAVSPRRGASAPPQQQPREHAIELSGLCFHPPGCEAPLLSDISMSLPPRSLSLVIGRSGSGKTTLLQLLSGLAEQTAGEVRACALRLPPPLPSPRPCTRTHTHTRTHSAAGALWRGRLSARNARAAHAARGPRVPVPRAPLPRRHHRERTVGRVAAVDDEPLGAVQQDAEGDSLSP
jgi:hypothetical protein